MKKNLKLIYVFIFVVLIILLIEINQFNSRYYSYSDKGLYQEFDKLVQDNDFIVNYKKGSGFPKGIEFDFEVNDHFNEEIIMNELIEIFQRADLNRMSKKREHYRKSQFEIRFSFYINDVRVSRYLTYITELENRTIQIWEQTLYVDDKATQVWVRRNDGEWWIDLEPTELEFDKCD